MAARSVAGACTSARGHAGNCSPLSSPSICDSLARRILRTASLPKPRAQNLPTQTCPPRQPRIAPMKSMPVRNAPSCSAHAQSEPLHMALPTALATINLASSAPTCSRNEQAEGRQRARA